MNPSRHNPTRKACRNSIREERRYDKRARKSVKVRRNRDPHKGVCA